MRGRLSGTDEERAANGARMRQGYADRAKLKNYGNRIGPGYDEHHVGARGEIYISNVTGLFWDPQVGVLDGTDVGDKIEVRTRRVPGSGTDLARRPQDKPKKEKPFVLVFAYDDGALEIIGWLYGREMFERTGPEFHGVTYIAPPYRSAESFIEKFTRKPTATVFVHYCHCGQWGSFGFGASLLKNRKGSWFCFAHLPQETPSQ